MFVYAISGAFVLGAFAFLFAATRRDVVCAVVAEPAQFERVASVLGSVVDINLTVIPAIIGASAALLIGLRPNVSLAKGDAVALLIASLGFVQSAIYGVWWKLRLANLAFNGSFCGIAHGYAQWVYLLHLSFMLIGICMIGLVTVRIAISRT